MSFPRIPGLSDDEQPSYVRLSHAADEARQDWQDIPRWQVLRRRKAREVQRTLSLASAYSYLGSTDTRRR